MGSPSRPTGLPSSTTPLVSSTPLLAEPTSTMVSSPSDTETTTARITTWSRTPGEAAGVTLDTLRSPTTEMVQVSAVSRWLPSAQLSELTHLYLSEILYSILNHISLMFHKT